MGIRITPLSMSIVVFVLTLGLLMRDRILDIARDGAHRSQAGAVKTTAGDIAPTPSAVSMGAAAIQHQAVQPGAPVQKTDTHIAPVTADMPVDSPSEADASAADTRPQSVPVTMVFHAGEGSDPKEARLQNLTNSPLSVSITAVEPVSRSQSTVEVTVPPHRRADLLAAGLSIHPGDEVRITNPQYSDLVFTAQ
jgi:hypothetical protein